MAQHSITLNINGMTCNGCVNSVTHALNQVQGVLQVQVHLNLHQAVICFDDNQTHVHQLKQTIEDVGFEVESMGAG